MVMKLAIVVVASSCLAAHKVSAFITTPRPSTIASNLQALPGIDQVATDGFMKQLGHASNSSLSFIHRMVKNYQSMK
jgi:hypothetical protein